MPTVFSRIIDGELPGRFIWRDPEVVSFLSINPITHGHALVVPRVEQDHWIDLDPALWARVCEVTRIVGRAAQSAFSPPRIATIIAGFEVPHVHVHVFQAASMADVDFARAQSDPDPDRMDAAATDLRGALRELGHAEHVAG